MTKEDERQSIVDTIDIEEYAKTGKAIPKAKKYMIKIDKEKYTVEAPELTARQILELAGKTPVEQFALYQKPKGGKPEKIDLDATVDFRAPGIERFTTLPLDQQEGEASRRLFLLPSEDLEFLDSLGKRWEAVIVGEDRRVVVYDNEVPPGYNVELVDVHFRIPTTYPDTQIDMAYFSPHLARADGKIIPNLSGHAFDGKQWQQWSRHRTTANPWRPGIDNLSTHYPLAFEWLLLEFVRR